MEKKIFDKNNLYNISVKLSDSANGAQDILDEIKGLEELPCTKEYFEQVRDTFSHVEHRLQHTYNQEFDVDLDYSQRLEKLNEEALAFQSMLKQMDAGFSNSDSFYFNGDMEWKRTHDFAKYLMEVSYVTASLQDDNLALELKHIGIDVAELLAKPQTDQEVKQFLSSLEGEIISASNLYREESAVNRFSAYSPELCMDCFAQLYIALDVEMKKKIDAQIFASMDDYNREMWEDHLVTFSDLQEAFSTMCYPAADDDILGKPVYWSTEESGGFINEASVNDLCNQLYKYNMHSKWEVRYFLANSMIETMHGVYLVGQSDSDDKVEGTTRYGGAGGLHITHDYAYMAFTLYLIAEHAEELQLETLPEIPNGTTSADKIREIYDTYVNHCNVDISQYTRIVTGDKDGKEPVKIIAEEYCWESACWYWRYFSASIEITEESGIGKAIDKVYGGGTDPNEQLRIDAYNSLEGW